MEECKLVLFFWNLYVHIQYNDVLVVFAVVIFVWFDLLKSCCVCVFLSSDPFSKLNLIEYFFVLHISFLL